MSREKERETEVDLMSSLLNWQKFRVRKRERVGERERVRIGTVERESMVNQKLNWQKFRS